MPVVGFSELLTHATDHQYGLALVNIHALPIASGIISSGSELDAPLALTVRGANLKDGLLPSLELMARQATIPLSLVAKQIQNTEQATRAIRLGCNGLVPAEGLAEAVRSEIDRVATACGIPVIELQALPCSWLEIDEELDSATLAAIVQAERSWQNVEQSIARAAADFLQPMITRLGSSGFGHAALDYCKPWRPVEHLIIYNTTTDDETSAEMAAEGRRVLDRIPGVRATWSGRAITADAGYRWCWLIRFAHPAVIDSYREHPDHVAYADNHFRPVAGDRVSIDYELTGADESGITETGI